MTNRLTLILNGIPAYTMEKTNRADIERHLRKMEHLLTKHNATYTIELIEK